LIIDNEVLNKTIKSHSFICDTPARSFLKMIKGHGSFSAKGALFIVNVAKTEQFMNKELRSDTSFRNQDFEHHNGHTLLI